MAIKYEYSSDCCNHFYIEIRNPEDNQVMTKCNSCGQGNYNLTSQTQLETIAEPVYVAVEAETEDLPVE
jgi:hypothetical protein